MMAVRVSVSAAFALALCLVALATGNVRADAENHEVRPTPFSPFFLLSSRLTLTSISPSLCAHTRTPAV